MINIKALRDTPDALKASLARRYPEIVPELDAILVMDAERRELLQRTESLKAERNSASEQVARLKKGKEDASDLLARLKETSASIKQLDVDLKALDGKLRAAVMGIPNVPLDDIPTGGAGANEILTTWGTPPTFDFAPKPHWEIGESLGLFDLPRGAKVAGSGFVVYTGQGARLVRALVNFMIDLHVTEHGYREVWPPSVVNGDSALGTGQLPDLEGQMYQVENDGLYLVPTAEVPVTNLHRDDLLRADQLPIAYVAYSPCFRREAGAHGKDTRGITRVHQFDKVELVRFCRPEDSLAEHALLSGHVEAVLQRLEIPYRTVALASGDIGFASAKTIDFEVWAGGVEAWLEASSASTFTDFQARRANIRYRPEPGAKPLFVHTLNASGLALPRTIIALVENNQQADGCVRVPEALVPYVGTDLLKPNA